MARWLTSIALLAGATVAIVGCQGSTAHIRRYTYPPDFRYIEQHELTTAMGRLAMAVDGLNRLLRGEGAAPAPDAVVAQLSDLQSIASRLTGVVGTNHPWLDKNLATFQQDIELAKRGASHDPPNYYLAGTIAGACDYCHQRGE